MKVGIGLKKSAYTPEAYAYADYLKRKGVLVQLADERSLCLDNDINIFFMGFRPFWVEQKGRALEIHEYQSLSTGAAPKVKDFIKRKFNRRPVGRIFLNEIVKRNIGFCDHVPSMCRDMGVDKALFQVPDMDPEYDIVYSGSISGRAGLKGEFVRLASMGFKLLVIGEVSKNVVEEFTSYPNVYFTGRVKREELPELYRKCRAGLNYTPDIYPFNIQTSTKTLEYLASGLSVLTNRYSWSENFFDKSDSRCFYLEDVSAYFEITPAGGGVDSYCWESVLKKSMLYDFLCRQADLGLRLGVN